MRLTDADALRKDDEVTEWITKDTIRTGKTLKAFSELFVKKIDNAPTVQAVPIEILDKIRAEINAEMRKMYMFRDYTNGLAKAFEIIDKYKEESEEV